MLNCLPRVLVLLSSLRNVIMQYEKKKLIMRLQQLQSANPSVAAPVVPGTSPATAEQDTAHHILLWPYTDVLYRISCYV